MSHPAFGRALAAGATLFLAVAAAQPTVAGDAQAEARRAEPAVAARRDRMATFDLAWRLVRDHYYDPAFNGVDWAAVGARYRPLAAQAADEEAYLALLRRMVGELRDSHTRILSPQQAADRRNKRTRTAGVILFEAEGRPVVYDVSPGSAADQAGVRRGMEVLAVNGVPIGEALARARAEVGPSSSERATRVLSYLRLIGGGADDRLRLDLATPEGESLHVELERRVADPAPRFEARRLPSGPLYVGFDRFRAPVARLFRAALTQHRDAPGLILDLRSNTGGDGEEGMRTIAPLLAGPTLVMRIATRSGKPPSALLGLVRLPMRFVAGEKGRQLYSGPVVVLTNEGTASTSEVIAASLQERGRARVIGTPTCGCALGVLRYRRLANGAALAISEVGLVSGLGRRIEGAGVVPDQLVAPRMDDLRSGRDPALEAAVRHLESGER